MGVRGVEPSSRPRLRWSVVVQQVVQDLGYGLRMLRRAPAMSVVAIGCLSLAIAANATVFSWIEGVLLRPFPLVQHEERMVAIAGTEAGTAGAPGESVGLSWPDFRDLRRDTTLFDWFIVDRIMGATFAVGDRAERAIGSIVSSNYFDALGAK